MSGFALWSVLNPRIEQYLDDPSRDQRPRRSVHAMPAFETATPLETDDDRSAATLNQAASGPLAA